MCLCVGCDLLRDVVSFVFVICVCLFLCVRWCLMRLCVLFAIKCVLMYGL